MRVLVAGASGYVGSRLVPALLERGHQIVATHTRETHPDFPWTRAVTWRRADVPTCARCWAPPTVPTRWSTS